MTTKNIFVALDTLNRVAKGSETEIARAKYALQVGIVQNYFNLDSLDTHGNTPLMHVLLLSNAKHLRDNKPIIKNKICIM